MSRFLALQMFGCVFLLGDSYGPWRQFLAMAVSLNTAANSKRNTRMKNEMILRFPYCKETGEAVKFLGNQISVLFLMLFSSFKSTL